MELWNEIFKKDRQEVPLRKESGNAGFDKGIEWVTTDAEDYW